MTATHAIDHEVRRPGINRLAERIRRQNPGWPEWHRQQVQTR